jgi:hypothetical protein
MNLEGSIMKNRSCYFICMWSHQNIKYICDRTGEDMLHYMTKQTW